MLRTAECIQLVKDKSMSRVYDLLGISKSPTMALTVPSGIYLPVDITAKLYLYGLESTATFSSETYRVVDITFSHSIVFTIKQLLTYTGQGHQCPTAYKSIQGYVVSIIFCYDINSSIDENYTLCVSTI